MTRTIILGIAAAALFAAGVGLGQALDDNEQGGGTETHRAHARPASACTRRQDDDHRDDDRAVKAPAAGAPGVNAGMPEDSG